MRHLKMLGLAAIAAMALTAFVGAGTASATVLTSPAGTALPAGTVIEATQTGSAVLEETGGTTLDTCTSSTVSGKTSEESGTPLKGNIETLDWGTVTTPCSVPTNTLVTGSFSVEANGNGDDNGTVRGSGTKVTLNIFGVSCVYGTGGGTTLGTLTGGVSATIDINAVIKGEGNPIICPTTTRWTATYTVTKPKPLFVS